MNIREKEYLEILKKQAEVSLGWGDSKAWSSSDFERLGDLVFEKTGVSLSASTLKRVLGKVKYDSLPTITTLNTLVQFLGYESWRNFCSQAQLNVPDAGTSPGLSGAADKAAPDKKLWPPRRIYAATFALFMLASVLAWMSFFNTPTPVIDGSKIVFTSKVVSDELPNSVVFTYDIGKFPADSVIIQQSWDPTRRETVPAHQHRHTSIYYFPGFFKAKLIVNNNIVSEHEVFIKTNGWQGIIHQASQTKPVYLSDKEAAEKNNSMEITASILKAKTGSAVFNDTWTTFYNIREFTADPENFTLEATLQNTSIKEAALCQQVKINILGSSSFMSIPLCSKGCTSGIGLTLGDSSINGKDDDLSAFGCDFAKEQTLKLVARNKLAVVYLNGKPVYTVPYTRSIGRIVGLMVGFEGAGRVRNISLK